MVAKQAGINIDDVRIQNLRIHDLRRTLGSWQAKTGASMAIIGKSLNHKSQQTTAIYARLDLDPVRQNASRSGLLSGEEQAGISITFAIYTESRPGGRMVSAKWQQNFCPFIAKECTRVFR